MVKIGGNSGGASFNEIDPFVGISHPLDREDAPGISWFSAGREIAKNLSLEWFGNYENVPLGEYFEKFVGEDPVCEFAKELVTKTNPDWLNERVIPSVLAGASSIGEFVPFSASKLGSKIVEFLKSKGIIGSLINLTPSGGLLVELPNIEGTSWQGAWGTEFGSRAFNRLEIYKDDADVEWCYVHTNLAVATRKPLLPGNASSKFISLPRLLLSQLFIAETPFPSAIFSIGRGIAYPEVPENLWPRPYVSVDDNALVTYTTGTTNQSGNIEHKFVSAPQVIRAGYAFSSDSEPYFENIIPTVVNATTNLSTIAEDGFRNYRKAGCDLPYDYFYGSEYVYFQGAGVYPGITASEGITVAGYSRFIPEVFLGALVQSTEKAIQLAEISDEPEKRRLLEWAALEGAGVAAASAINTLCFSYLMPDNNFETAASLLERAIDLDVANESTNAMSNLGQVLNSMGDVEKAKNSFERALDRLDKFSEGEACYHLGLLLREQGDLDSATKYWERGAKAAGKYQEEFSSLCREKLSESSTSTAGYCSECGSKRNKEAKFCGDCGSKFINQ